VRRRLRDAGVDVVVLDIEGTTTPVAFVYDVLFPYAHARLAAWFKARSLTDPDVREIVMSLQQELHGETGAAAAWTIDDVVSTLLSYMDHDRKSRALKTAQGRVWEEGYATGQLRGEVYPDVPPALARWHAQGCAVGIFSSGSVLAQKLLFANSNAGDLTPLLRWHFDTAVGAKADARSYRRIAGSVNVPAASILFVSDVVAELEAAREAGMKTLLCVRPPATAASAAFAVIHTFDEIDAAGTLRDGD
jgi:enolase-phosphatase E1